MPTLAQLKKGQSATIEAFEDQEIALKLFELGCLPGQAVVLEHIAPMGDPIAISFNGSMVSLRKAEANSINVKFAS
jgi:ferrous iron transport protein A